MPVYIVWILISRQGISMGWVGRRVESEKESSLSNTLLTHCYFSHTFYFHVCVYDVYMYI